VNTTAVVELPLECLRPDPEQHRKIFTEEDLRGLADSIASQGQIMPVKVKPDPGGPTEYLLIDGERRYRACVLAGIPTIRAEVCEDLSPFEVANIQGAANLTRRDVEPCAAGRAVKRSMDALREERPWLTEEEARKVVQGVYGLSGQYVVAKLRLLALPVEVQAKVDSGGIKEQTALELLRLVERGDEAEAKRLAQKAESNGLSLLQVKELVNAHIEGAAQGSLFGAGTGEDSAEVREVRSRLSRAVPLLERAAELMFDEGAQAMALGKLRRDELEVAAAKLGGLLRTFQAVLCEVQRELGQEPDLSPQPVVASGPARAVGPTQGAPAVEAAGPEPTGPPALRQAVLAEPTLAAFGEEAGIRVSLVGEWLWVYGVGEPGRSSLAYAVQRAGGRWAQGRRAWYCPHSSEQAEVQRVIREYLSEVGGESESVTTAALEAAG
jgi:ParB family chromosome partitioning protein